MKLLNENGGEKPCTFLKCSGKKFHNVAERKFEKRKKTDNNNTINDKRQRTIRNPNQANCA